MLGRARAAVVLGAFVLGCGSTGGGDSPGADAAALVDAGSDVSEPPPTDAGSDAAPVDAGDDVSEPPPTDAGPDAAPLDGASDALSDAPSDVVFVSEPVLTLNPNPNAPLAAILTLQTDRPTALSIVLGDGTEDVVHAYPGTRTAHEQVVLGLHPGSTYTVRVTVTDESGRQQTYPTVLSVVTPVLPSGFPRYSVPVAVPERMEAGYTVFNALERTDGPSGYILIVDSSGQVVWYYHDPVLEPMDVRRLGNGDLLFNSSGHAEVVEIDMLGNPVRHWQAIPDDATPVPAGVTRIPTAACHHEIYPTGSSFLTLSAEVRSVVGFPTSGTDLTPRTAPTVVGGDIVVEFADDGTILHQWPLLDLLDPTRVGYLSFSAVFFPGLFGPGIYDWAHGNAVFPDSRDDTLIASSRAQNAVFKFTRAGDLVWILGAHENWTAAFAPYLLTPVGTGAFAWPYAQHAPEITPRGTLLLFDNGNEGASPPDPTVPARLIHSRAVEYAIDEATLEVSQVWQYGGELEPPLFAQALGDADPLPVTSNVLITFGWLVVATNDVASAHIREVTHTTPAEVVFDLELYDRRRVYRADRVASLYPDE